MTNMIRKFIDQPSTKAALGVFMASRIVILVGSLLVVLFPLFNAIHLSDGFSQLWYRWDTTHYVDIAVGAGYWYKPNSNSTVAFFPLYPMLIRALTSVIHDPVIAGLLINQIAFIFAIILIYQIVSQITNKLDANRTIIYLALFPAALFYFVAYSESVFLLFSVLTWYAARRAATSHAWQWWLIAGLSGMLTSATRAAGVIIILFPLEAWLRSHNVSSANLLKVEWWKSLLQDWFPVLTMLLIPLGLLGFMVYLGVVFHEPLLFLRIQEEGWGFKTLGPIAIITQDVSKLIQGIPISPNALVLYGWIDLAAFLLTLLLSVTIFRYLGWGATLYSLVSLLIPISSRLESMARYTVVLVPVFIGLAIWGRNPKLDFTLRIIFLFGLVLTTFLFLENVFVG